MQLDAHLYSTQELSVKRVSDFDRTLGSCGCVTDREVSYLWQVIDSQVVAIKCLVCVAV